MPYVAIIKDGLYKNVEAEILIISKKIIENLSFVYFTKTKEEFNNAVKDFLAKCREVKDVYWYIVPDHGYNKAQSNVYRKFEKIFYSLQE